VNNKKFKEQLVLAKKQGLELDARIERKTVNGLPGMFATEHIPADTLIAAYPHRSQIPLLSDFPYPDTASFTFKYIHAAALELTKGPASKHYDILMSLETMIEIKNHCCYFYTDKDLQLIRQLNPVLARNIDEANHKVKIRVDALKKIDPELNENIIIRVILNIFSRSYGGFGFAAVLDAFNHSDEKGSLVNGLSGEKEYISIQSAQSYERGDQIFISYDTKDMYAHAISYNYFDPSGMHFIDYGARIVQTATSPIEKRTLQHTASLYKITAKEFSGVIQYSAKDQQLFMQEAQPSDKLIEYVRNNCFQSEQELSSGKCTDLSFDTRMGQVLDDMLAANHVDDFELSDIPKKLHRFYHLLHKEKQILLANKQWLEEHKR